MQKSINILLSLSLFLIFSINVDAQSLAKNSKGETIVQFPDGSWRYFDENDTEDQRLMRDHIRNQVKEDKKNSQAVARINDDDVSDKGNSTPIYSDIAENEARLAAKDRLHQARRELNLFQTEESTAMQNFERVTVKLANLKLRKPKPKAATKQLKLERKQAKLELKTAAKAKKAAEKKMELYKKMVDMSIPERDKQLAKIEKDQLAATIALDKPIKDKKSKKNKASDEDYYSTNDSIEKPAKKKQPKKKKNKASDEDYYSTNDNIEKPVKKKKKNKTIEQTYSSSNPNKIKSVSDYLILADKDDVVLNPPSRNCEISFDGIDDFSGKYRRDVAPQEFFAHTSDQLRGIYNGEERIVCFGNLTNVTGGYKFITLKLIVNDEQAQRTYGILEKSSMLTIKLIDGTNVALLNNKTDQGILDKVNRKVIYYGQFMITPNQQKHLEKTEIDLIRLVWSTGYEDYEIYETDFLINQFECLKSDTK